MHWSTAENVAAIVRAMELARSRGAELCAFSELAVTGYHRLIAREATAEIVGPALSALQAHCATLSLGIAVGAPTFGAGAAKYISHYFVDECGLTQAIVSKRGLTEAEATFFQPGASRPSATLRGLRCSAVLCREVADLALVTADLPAGSVDVILVPGALRQDPEKPRTDPPEYVRDIQRLAARHGPTSSRPIGRMPSIGPKKASKAARAPSPRPTATSCSDCLARSPASPSSNSAQGRTSGTGSDRNAS